MPQGDGTGLMGFGPMIGRAAGYSVPGFANPAFGYGGWGGRGGRGGRGFDRRYWAAGFPGFNAVPYVPANQAIYPAGSPDPAMEASMLTNQIEMMEQSLKDAKERLNVLKNSGE